MHDGSIASLDEAIDHYAAEGRTIASGPYAGVGSRARTKSSLVIGFELTPDERAFLHSLTDKEFLTSTRFASPWNEPCITCDRWWSGYSPVTGEGFDEMTFWNATTKAS